VTEILKTITPAALGTLEAIVAGAAIVIALFAGLCVLMMFPKLRPSGPHSRVVRSLGELVGEPEKYLPPDRPRGPIDQLRAGTSRAAQP
jgi:hypothetical protein